MAAPRTAPRGALQALGWPLCRYKAAPGSEPPSRPGPEPAPLGTRGQAVLGSQGLLVRFSRGHSTDSGSWTLSWEVGRKSLSSTGDKNVPYSVTRSDTGVPLRPAADVGNSSWE